MYGSVSRDLHVLACAFVRACMHACGWRNLLLRYVRMWILHLWALLLQLCFHGDTVTYCCTEDSASVPVFVRRIDVCRQVQLLISQATSPENLCQCYIGW